MTLDAADSKQNLLLTQHKHHNFHTSRQVPKQNRVATVLNAFYLPVTLLSGYVSYRYYNRCLSLSHG